MSEVRYMISDASKQLEVEPHVLRYWEEELEINIPRNEMGHRYYRTKDINTLQSIKELKEKGFGLKAIKMLLPDIDNIEQVDINQLLYMQETLDKQVSKLEGTVDIMNDNEIDTRSHIREETRVINISDVNDSKMQQFQAIMSELMMEALVKNNEQLTNTISDTVTERVTKEVDELLKVQESRAEERYKRFDMNIRELQKTRMEIAAATNAMSKRKTIFGVFKKHK